MRLLIVVWVLSIAPTLWAQDVVVAGPEVSPTMDDIATARERFAAGSGAAEEGRWSDALAAFRTSYELSGIAAALYNTATTYRSLGRYRLARDAFVQLLRDHPELGESMRDSAVELRIEVAGRVASLELLNLPDDATLSLRLDGRQRDDTLERPLVLDVDEGRHTLAVSREGYEPFAWDGEAAGGETETIDVTLVERESQSNAGRVILIVSLIAVVVAGGVVAGLLLRDTGLEPESETVVNLL
ncbi:MAG: tetratricopeptide (TPR) repeat protein [Polyangiales bacterium]|jgi:tetratricopeptide (TPR) repeat protein